MKICFIADIRSSIARNWIGYFPQHGYDVHVLATDLAEDTVIPGATIHGLVPAAPAKPRTAAGAEAGLSSVKFRFDPSELVGRTAFAMRSKLIRPIKCLRLRARAQKLIEAVKPDMLHALRIPIEGELGAMLGVHPFIVSIWGNDLTLHAKHSLAHRLLTRKTLRAVDGLHADTQIDLERARAFAPLNQVPKLCTPGCGGLKRDLFAPGHADPELIRRLGIDPERPLVLNPRGLRQYVRQDTFLAAIPKVLAARPDVQFLALDLRGWRRAEKWIAESGAPSALLLAGHLSQQEMAAVYKQALLTVSPTEHDGTPNTMLEAMASGCLPVCGDLPSIREWIEPGVNGLLVDPGNPDDLAKAILTGLADGKLRERAARRNLELIVERADYDKCMCMAEEFYHDVIGGCAAQKTATRVEIPTSLTEERT